MIKKWGNENFCIQWFTQKNCIKLALFSFFLFVRRFPSSIVARLFAIAADGCRRATQEGEGTAFALCKYCTCRYKIVIEESETEVKAYPFPLLLETFFPLIPEYSRTIPIPQSPLHFIQPPLTSTPDGLGVRLPDFAVSILRCRAAVLAILLLLLLLLLMVCGLLLSHLDSAHEQLLLLLLMLLLFSNLISGRW
jgi:hypothetical protein